MNRLLLLKNKKQLDWKLFFNEKPKKIIEPIIEEKPIIISKTPLKSPLNRLIKPIKNDIRINKKNEPININPEYKSLKINLNYIFKISNKLERVKELLGEIYYINMESRTDRKKIMENRLKNLTLDFTRFNAYCINNKNYKNFYESYPQLNFSNFYSLKNTPWKKGTIGCFMSHYLILKELERIENPKKYYLILEDDCCPTLDHILASLEFAENFPDLDLLRLNSFNNLIKEISEFGWKVDKNHIYYTDETNNTINFDGGTHYVLIKHNKIRKILDFMESEKIFIIDGMYNTTKLNSYWLNFSHKIIYNSLSSIKNGDISKVKRMVLLRK